MNLHADYLSGRIAFTGKSSQNKTFNYLQIILFAGFEHFLQKNRKDSDQTDYDTFLPKLQFHAKGSNAKM